MMVMLMIPIDNSTKIGAPKRPERKKIASSGNGGAFSSLMDALSETSAASETVVANNVAASTPLSALDMLLSVQSAGEALQQRQKQLRHAHLTLDTLEELRHALLMGSVPIYLLQSIETRMGDMKHHSISPELRDIMEEIELRAAVELAKFRLQR
jgi:Class II flagellar assembly regulator